MFDRGELVTIAKIRQHLEKKVKHDTVRRAMTDMGFTFKRRGIDFYVRERSDIVTWRIRFVNLPLCKKILFPYTCVYYFQK